MSRPAHIPHSGLHRTLSKTILTKERCAELDDLCPPPSHILSRAGGGGIYFLPTQLQSLFLILAQPALIHTFIFLAMTQEAGGSCVLCRCHLCRVHPADSTAQKWPDKTWADSTVSQQRFPPLITPEPCGVIQTGITWCGYVCRTHVRGLKTGTGSPQSTREC